MPRAHTNGARTRRTPPARADASRPSLRLDVADDAPGWTLGDDPDEARPLTVAQAVRHAIDTHGPSGAALVLGATRDVLGELPEHEAVQLRAELASAAPGVLADVRDGLAILRDVLDALAPVAPPDLLGELSRGTERVAARAVCVRGQLGDHGPVRDVLAAIVAGADR